MSASLTWTDHPGGSKGDKMRLSTRSGDPISSFFLNHAAFPTNTAIGREFAKVMVQELKRDNPGLERPVLFGYLDAWNRRGGSPFTWDELNALAMLEPAPKKPRSKHKAQEDPGEGSLMELMKP